jgi:hypothetical protein
MIHSVETIFGLLVAVAALALLARKIRVATALVIAVVTGTFSLGLSACFGLEVDSDLTANDEGVVDLPCPGRQALSRFVLSGQRSLLKWVFPRQAGLSGPLNGSRQARLKRIAKARITIATVIGLVMLNVSGHSESVDDMSSTFSLLVDFRLCLGCVLLTGRPGFFIPLNRLIIPDNA